MIGAGLEMLFVDAAQRGSRVGSALLDHAVGMLGVTEVDVNEQNASAVDFFTRRGIAVVGRRNSDDEGRPYPLLHLRLTPSVQPTASLCSAPFDADTC